MRVIFPPISDHASKLKGDGESCTVNDVTEIDTLQQKDRRLLPSAKKYVWGYLRTAWVGVRCEGADTKQLGIVCTAANKCVKSATRKL